MRLVHDSNGLEVQIGDKIRCGDELLKVIWMPEPHKPSSSGKITMENMDGHTFERFVGIYGLTWIEREDR